MLLAGLTMLLFVAASHTEARANEKPVNETVLPCSDQGLSSGRERIVVFGGSDPPFSTTEKRLLCGDLENEAWKSIPLSQASFHLKTFLQQRGYHYPAFETATLQSGQVQLRVQVGEPTRVSRIIVEGAPEFLHFREKRNVIGEKLTPTLINSVEQWTYQKLQNHGYPCGRVTSEADPKTGTIKIAVETGPLQNLIAVEESPIEGLNPGILRRYDAFALDEPFNDRLHTLTAERIARQNVIQSAHFTTECSPNGAITRQQVIAGAPRLLSLGLGADTEGGIIGRANWRNARLGPNASWFEVTAYASTIEQRLETSLNWYYLDRPSRQSIRPLLRLSHDNELYYETMEFLARASFATSADGREAGLVAQVGPAFNAVRTLRGIGPSNSHFLSLDGQLSLQSHDFEFFAATPRSGYRVTLDISSAGNFLLSTASATRIGMSAQYLHNFRSFDPPLFVIGVRGGLLTTLTSERPSSDTGLPAQYFHFLGGSQTLRGFDRQRLPTNGLGALTALFLGLELRLANTLPTGLEPVAFVDLGGLGQSPLNIDLPIYGSPGVGLRWATAIGVFRGTLARGFPTDTPGGWQLYLSYGEEF